MTREKTIQRTFIIIILILHQVHDILLVSQTRRIKGAGHLLDRKREMHIRKEITVVGNILMEFLDIPYVMFTSEHQK